MSFHPYLFFGGDCREAFERYQEIFGGELFVVTGTEMGAPPEMADVVMHAAVRVGDDVLMGSDDPTSTSFGPVQGMMVNFGTEDVEEGERVFAALSEGGEVREALAETSFAKRFGMCVDRFGTPWMVTAGSMPPPPG